MHQFRFWVVCVLIGGCVNPSRKTWIWLRLLIFIWSWGLLLADICETHYSHSGRWHGCKLRWNLEDSTVMRNYSWEEGSEGNRMEVKTKIDVCFWIWRADLFFRMKTEWNPMLIREKQNFNNTKNKVRLCIVEYPNWTSKVLTSKSARSGHYGIIIDSNYSFYEWIENPLMKAFLCV